ncbi:MAG: hypothetical protein I3265_02510 [Candidatus Moeniiplasma glomeromycotorum]|nr:hypothetical protein [Candidatus Moeniiplasma glomeromycotorum]
MNYEIFKKKKKKKKKKKTIYLTLIVSGILVVAGIGTITYLAWPKGGTKTETKNQNKEAKTQQLQSQLSQIQNVLNKPENSSKKVVYATKLSEIENKLKTFFQQKLEEQEKTIQDLTQNIKTISQELKIPEKIDDPKPKPDQPTKNPEPNPDPNQNELTKYIVTEINDNTFKYRFTVNNDKQNCQGFDEVSYSDFIHLLKTPQHPQYKEFFQAFQGALKDANSKFPAYFWKCPPVSTKTLGKPFEFVVIKSEALNNITQNYSSFQEHFGKSRDNQAVSFSSPSGNLLVCPVPKGTADYKNISQFTKNAPLKQQQALWKKVADKLIGELEKNPDTPRWLNTEGTGVPYLHVRLDATPRFYGNYPEYKKF